MVLQVHQGDITQKQFVVSGHISSVEEENSLQTLFCSLCLYWMDAESAKKRLPNLLEPLYRRSRLRLSLVGDGNRRTPISAQTK